MNYNIILRKILCKWKFSIIYYNRGWYCNIAFIPIWRTIKSSAYYSCVVDKFNKEEVSDAVLAVVKQ